MWEGGRTHSLLDLLLWILTTHLFRDGAGGGGGRAVGGRNPYGGTAQGVPDGTRSFDTGGYTVNVRSQGTIFICLVKGSIPYIANTKTSTCSLHHQA